MTDAREEGLNKAREAGRDDYHDERRMQPPEWVVGIGMIDTYIEGYRQAYRDATVAARASVATRSMVEGLKTGDVLPNCFGRLRAVKEVYGRGVSPDGRAFVCFTQEFGPTSTMSNCLHEGSPVASFLATASMDEPTIA